MASPILNVTELWVASTGEILDQSGTSQFHAQNNYANLILVNLEDGVGYDSTTLINFTPQTKSAYTSHWFYMSYQGLVEHEVGGEVRNFAQYAIRVPRVVLQNSNKNGITVNDVVVKQTYGTNFIGQFATFAELNSEYPPTEALDDDDSIAYVISPLNSVQRGFYQVELDGTYGWTLMDNVALALESKQYNQFQIQVQAGSANPNDVVSVSAENVTVIMGILNNLQIDIDRIDANIDEVEEDIDTLEGRATVNEEDIDLLEGRATVLEIFKDTTVPATYETKTDAATHKLRTTALEGRATNLETFQSTTVPATYETISNVDLVRDRVDDLETFEDVTVPATYETKVDATSKLALKVDKTTTIANVAIDNGITLDELKTAIGLATTSVSGLMSPTDKGYLNELYALLDTDDVDVLVNTLGEILALFENYPEGTDIVTAFAGKVDKVLTAYDTLTGESVVGTEFVYVDAGGTAKKMTLSELFEASNNSAGAFVPNGVYEDLTSGFAINSQSGVNIDTKFGTIDGEIDNIIDGTQNITFDNTVSELTATTVKSAIDEIDANVDDIIDGTTVIEESYNTNTILTHDLTYVSGGDFKANLKTIDEDKIVFVKFPNTSSTSTLRVSLDNGVTYYNVVKNGKTMQAFIASEQLVRLEFDGTRFIADIQGDVDVEATYGEPVESTYGEFAPLDGGVPLVTEIQGLLLDAPQLVTNGDFSDGTTGWS
ncbi:hypothetical protein, partial [Methanoculleus sp.]|uniref:hypothetical protein n=1 Tax=Methanoculleus sp. TaxID=90427 RepID=UPI0025CF9B47